MAIAQLTAWLRSPDKNYQLGVALYDQYGSKPTLKIFFRNGSSDYHHIRLQEALEELALLDIAPQTATEAAGAAPITIPALDAIPVPAKLFSLTDEQWNSTPAQIRDLYVTNHRLKSRADLLFMQAGSAPTAEERLQLSLAQLNDRADLNKNWKQIKEYHATGALQEQITQEQETPIGELSLPELLKLEKNLPTYITKDRKRINGLKVNSTPYDKTYKRLQENTIKLKLVKERLANV
jgi:hypothetical protein